MKKILLFTILCTALAGCQVYSSSNTEVNSYDLMSYASHKFGQYVAAPAEITEMLLEFDDYMKLPDAEKEKNTRFYGKIDVVYDNIYRFADNNEQYVYCTVDTKGKSLREEGTTWIFAQARMTSPEEILNYYYGEYTLPEFTQLTKTGENTWTMEYEDVFETEMKYMGKDNGRDMWEIRTSGSLKSDIGAWATFSTGDQVLTMKEMMMASDSVYKGNAYGGVFRVDIYDKDDKSLDFCQISFMPGFSTKYTTSR